MHKPRWLSYRRADGQMAIVAWASDTDPKGWRRDARDWCKSQGFKMIRFHADRTRVEASLDSRTSAELARTEEQESILLGGLIAGVVATRKGKAA